ncbi:MAG: hypothetical protein R3B09_24765 [Nannocystaceae bacterium]
MGYRAHFLIREGGALRLHASHWGGQRLLRDLLHGPSIFAAYVESTRAVGELYYEDAVDGVALVDHDRRALTFWGGDNLGVESIPGLRRRYLELLRGRWPGWAIRWEPGGIRAIAASVAVPVPASIDGPSRGELRVQALLDGALGRDPGPRENVVSVRENAHSVHNVRAGWDVDALLTLGPRLVDEVRAQAPAPLPRESLPDPDDEAWERRGGILLDVEARRIECWWNWPATRRVEALPLLARFWPGWTLALAVDGLVVHAERGGRPRAAVELPLAEAAAALERRLFAEEPAGAEDAVEPAAIAREALAAWTAQLDGAPGAELTIAAGLLGDEGGLPPPLELRGQIARRLAR